MILRRLAAAISKQDWFIIWIEFVLIVVGLLIALQIDNWNQLRKDRADEAYYLTRILGDIDESIAENRNNIEFMRTKVDSTLWVVEKLRSGRLEPGEGEEFKRRFLEIQNWKTGSFIDSTIQELQSSGRMTIIQSRALREYLGRFELRLESHWRAQANIADFFKALDLQIIPRVDRPVGHLKGILDAPFTDLGSEESFQVLLTPFESLANDRVLIRYLDAYATYYIWRTLNIEMLQQELRELRQRIVLALEG
jgi:hypothetical protein